MTFESDSTTSTLQYADVRFGGAGGATRLTGMVEVDGGTVSFLDSTFTHSLDSGIVVSGGSSGTASTVAITRTMSAQNGFAGSSLQGDGLYANQGNVTIRDSGFWSNASRGVDMTFNGGFTPALPTMAGTSVWNNRDFGVYIDNFFNSAGLVGQVSGQLPNEIYDNGSFGFSSAESWNQLGTVSSSAGLDWSGVYWGPVTYQACDLGNQRGHLSYRAPDPTPSSSLPVDRGPANNDVGIGSAGGWIRWCGNDRVLVDAPRLVQPDLQFDPPPPSFGGVSTAELLSGMPCGGAANLAASLDGPGVCAAYSIGSVSTATGQYFENDTDLSLADPGAPFTWSRSYNSADTTSGALGKGWTHMFAASLSGGLASAAAVTYRAGSGQQTLFTNASGSSSGAATYYGKGFDGTFNRLSDGTFTMVTRDQRTFRFNSSGQLTSITPRFTAATTLTYSSGKLSSITDPAGRTVTITYSVGSPSLISELDLPDGRKVQYGYSSGLLTSVTDARGKITTLSYDGNDRLTSVKDAVNHYRVQAITYDSQGRVTSQEDGAGEATTHAYSNDGTYDIRTVTFPGHTGSWVYKQINNVLVSTTDPLGHTTTYSFDGMARSSSVTDQRGYTTTFQYDHSGNRIKTSFPASVGFSTSATYNATNDLLSETDGRSHTTNYSYATSSDPAADYQVGQLKSVTDRESGLTTYKYLTSTSSPTPPAATVGLPKSMTDPRSKTWSYDYDSSGNPTKVTSPLGLKTTFGYDSSGRLTSKRDPRGNAVTPAAGYLTQWAYNDTDQLTTLTPPVGNPTSYDYYDNGLLHDVVLTDRSNVTRTTSYAYDAANRLYTKTDPRSGVETRLYWPDGTVKQVTSPEGRITKYGYDDDSHPTTVISPKGNVTGATASDYTTTYGYDNAGNRHSAQHPDGGTSYVDYDALNRPYQYTDANSHSTTLTYDPNGNVTQETDALSHSTTYDYDNLNRLTKVTNPYGKHTDSTYFATGQLASTTTSLGNKTTYTLDDDGRVHTMVEPRGNVTGGTPSQYTWTYDYDEAGNRTRVTDPLSHQTNYSYDAANDLTGVTDANSNSTGFTFDVLNRLWKVTPPAAGNTGTLDTVYSYDPDGNLASKVDPNSNTTSWAYDLDGLPTQKTTAVGSWNSSYDRDGNLTSLETPVGSSTGTAGDGTISYGYDRMGRPTGVTYSDSTASVSRSYDDAGRLTGMTDGSGSVSYNYDNANRITDITRTGGGAGLNGTLHYDYDNADRIIGRTYPDSTTTATSYTDDGQIHTVASGGATTTFGYDEAGNLTTITLPSGNGYVETRGYDRAGRLTSVDNAKSGTSLSKFSWTRDNAGNPTNIDTLRGGSHSYDAYQYDARNRITTACYGIASTATDCTGASNTIAYSYDKLDNISQQVRAGTVPNTGTTSYSYNSSDQLASTTKSGTTTNYSYDGNGNETSDGSNSFTYNLANQLISSTTGGVATSYGYDGAGNRLTSQTSGGADLNYSWDPNADTGIPEPILERTSTGSLTRRYLDGPAGAISMATSSASFYYHHDPLNSTSDLTDATGTPQWAYSYEPYGATLTASNVSGGAPENRVRFTSQYADTQTSTYNLRARQYDPATGRFGALDPLPGSTATAAVGSYVYVDGQPTLLTDPLGLCAPLECLDEALAIASQALGHSVHSLTDLVDVAFAEVKAELAQAASDAAHAAANSNLLRGIFGFEPTSGNGGWQYQLGFVIGVGVTFLAPEIRTVEILNAARELRGAAAAGRESGVFSRILTRLSDQTGSINLFANPGRAPEGETLYRFGTQRLTAEELDAQAKAAQKLGFPHGVSTTAKPPVRPGAPSAPRSAVEQQFPVHDTPTIRNPLHHRTVELPDPVTQADADRFHDLFGFPG